MRFYFAGAETFQDGLRESGASSFLVSYINYRKKGIENKLPTDNLFLDSGAFSAWSQGTVIDIDDYISYLKLHGEKFDVYANLDVIGDPEGTDRNQDYMMSGGVNPLPVVHYGAPLGYLTKYAEAHDYIALGGLVPYAKEPVLLRNWLNKAFKILTPYILSKGLKVHGFGVGSAEILKKYPFYSADSTGWLVGGQFGTVVNWDNQKYKMTGGAHYKDKETYLTKGNDLKLTIDYKERLKHNIKEYLKMEAAITKLWKNRGISFD